MALSPERQSAWMSENEKGWGLDQCGPEYFEVQPLVSNGLMDLVMWPWPLTFYRREFSVCLTFGRPRVIATCYWYFSTSMMTVLFVCTRVSVGDAPAEDLLFTEEGEYRCRPIITDYNFHS